MKAVHERQGHRNNDYFLVGDVYIANLEDNGAVGNDLFELDRSRHGGKHAGNSGSGGSNYAFCDGSVRYIKYGDILWPLNLWAATDEGRIAYAVKR